MRAWGPVSGVCEVKYGSWEARGQWTCRCGGLRDSKLGCFEPQRVGAQKLKVARLGSPDKFQRIINSVREGICVKYEEHFSAL